MATFLYRCPNNGQKVQGWSADEVREDDRDVYQPITCLACRRLHFVNPKSGALTFDP
jgi:hypothetical protein